MKKLKWMFLGMAMMSLMSSCFHSHDDDDNIFGCKEGTGATVTETLNVNDFTGVELSFDADVFITQGSPAEVVVEGQQNIVDLIETDVQDNIWQIEFDQCVADHDDVQIFITMPAVDYLKVSGSGSIFGENVFDANNMTLRVSGSGNMNVDVNASEVDGKISGSGKMLLGGVTDHLDFRISGSGDLKAFDLETTTCDLNISGSGDAEVWVSDHLDIKISGSGDVYYKGFPTIDVSISGSGDVINAN